MTEPASDKTACTVCPHACMLASGQLGRCKARRNENGRIVPESYGRITGIALDPIEKKPLARFMPGSQVLSVGSYGCNLDCPFCQNASIAQARSDEVGWHYVSPDELVARARLLIPQGNVGIAYTYNEPLICWEYVRDCAQLAHEAGLVNVLVSNGQANSWVIEKLAPHIDAANIDLKGFTQAFYDFAGGDLACVKQTITSLAHCESCHLEVTTLIIPGKNDDEREIEAIASWLAELDRDIPYHISRFFPCHRMTDAHPTPVGTIYRLADIARRHLTHVYTGNC